MRKVRVKRIRKALKQIEKPEEKKGMFKLAKLLWKRFKVMPGSINC